VVPRAAPYGRISLRPRPDALDILVAALLDLLVELFPLFFELLLEV
jgi:hypothetical protein